MIPLANLLFACSDGAPASHGANGSRGSSSLEAGDTEPGVAAGTGTVAEDGDTGNYDKGAVTDVRITLPSPEFSTSAGDWFPVEFALVDDTDEPQDHWATSLAVTLVCDGENGYIGGLDEIPGMMALNIGGGINPREVTVMIVSTCDVANLKASMVAYNDTPPINAYSDSFIIR